MSTTLKITQIRRDGGTQLRTGTNEDTILEYAEAMRAGRQFPPVTVIEEDSIYWMGDGFQRAEARLRCGLETIEADVLTEYKGETGRRAAILFACGANDMHGLRRSSEDKKRAVLKLLEDSEWSVRSDRWIAEVCKVSDHFVAKTRPGAIVRTSTQSVNDPKEQRAAPGLPPGRMGKDGKTYKIREAIEYPYRPFEDAEIDVIRDVFLLSTGWR